MRLPLVTTRGPQQMSKMFAHARERKAEGEQEQRPAENRPIQPPVCLCGVVAGVARASSLRRSGHPSASAGKPVPAALAATGARNHSKGGWPAAGLTVDCPPRRNRPARRSTIAASAQPAAAAGQFAVDQRVAGHRDGAWETGTDGQQQAHRRLTTQPGLQYGHQGERQHHAKDQRAAMRLNRPTRANVGRDWESEQSKKASGTLMKESSRQFTSVLPRQSSHTLPWLCPRRLRPTTLRETAALLRRTPCSPARSPAQSRRRGRREHPRRFQQGARSSA